tara:strand:+ start:376 stop:657 length:282 start_codon:yes stop_codon:yes gene_type:complete
VVAVVADVAALVAEVDASDALVVAVDAEAAAFVFDVSALFSLTRAAAAELAAANAFAADSLVELVEPSPVSKLPPSSIGAIMVSESLNPIVSS